MNHFMRLLAAVLGLVLLSGTTPASAASIGLSPVRVDLSARNRVEAITVKNQGQEPAVVQLETMAWTKAEGKDIYTPTRDLVATPPIFTVPPGGTQVVRIGLRRAAEPTRDGAYRVFFQEVPSPPKPGFRGLQVLLRLGVPVFVAPAAGAERPAPASR